MNIASAVRFLTRIEFVKANVELEHSSKGCWQRMHNNVDTKFFGLGEGKGNRGQNLESDRLFTALLALQV